MTRVVINALLAHMHWRMGRLNVLLVHLEERIPRLAKARAQLANLDFTLKQDQRIAHPVSKEDLV
jgi:hypothetical protein